VAEVRARIDTYLDSIDTRITADQWRALGPEGAKVLAELAQDQKRLPTRRARALSALAVVGAADAPKLMVELAQRETEKSVVRMSALRGAALLLDPSGLMAAAKPVMEGSKDARVRAAAAAELVKKNPQEACGAVKTQAGKERAGTRPAFERALRLCGGAAPGGL
jgi:hypothetical protein